MFIPPPSPLPPPGGPLPYVRTLDPAREGMFAAVVANFEWGHAHDDVYTNIRDLICHPRMPGITAQ